MPFTTTPPAFTWANLNNTWSTLADNWVGQYDLTSNLTIGDTPENITNDAFTITTGRGRNRDLQRTNAGTIAVALRNETRKFDPKGDSTIQPLIRPRIPINLQVDGLPVFEGVINDWDFNYSLGGQSTASISGADAFTFFARETSTGTAIAESSGSRLNKVLDELPKPFPTNRRNIDAGNATLHADTYDENALSYIQNIEESEGGIIFISKTGDVEMRQRQLQFETEVPTFTDQNNGIPYSNVDITFGTDLLANSVTVSSVEGTAVAINQDSILENGVSEENLDTILASASLQGLAESILFRFGTPEYRVAAVTVNLLGLDATKRGQVLSLELGTQVLVEFTPNSVGDPISIDNKIIGISHSINLNQHNVTFNFEDVGFPLFVLDDPEAGILDNTEFRIGF